MPRMSGAATPRTAARRTTSRSSSARRAGAAGKAGRPKAAFLVPTASYMAYANDHNHLDGERGRDADGAAAGLSDRGSLSAGASRARLLALRHPPRRQRRLLFVAAAADPQLRPKYASWLGAHGSGLWQFNADTHLIDWLEHEGVAVDLVTDRGPRGRRASGCSSPIAVVLTGTHPEYHSKRMSDAMLAWQEQGGRLMYLGANGWYWRIAWHPELPGVIEVRRAEDGIRTWAAEPGEYYHSFTGEFGGLWRRNGRPPNVVVGLGFSAQGFDSQLVLPAQARVVRSARRVHLRGRRGRDDRRFRAGRRRCRRARARSGGLRRSARRPTSWCWPRRRTTRT